MSSSVPAPPAWSARPALAAIGSCACMSRCRASGCAAAATPPDVSSPAPGAGRCVSPLPATLTGGHGVCRAITATRPTSSRAWSAAGQRRSPHGSRRERCAGAATGRRWGPAACAVGSGRAPGTRPACCAARPARGRSSRACAAAAAGASAFVVLMGRGAAPATRLTPTAPASAWPVAAPATCMSGDAVAAACSPSACSCCWAAAPAPSAPSLSRCIRPWSPSSCHGWR
jgi:hypothetical protein